MHKPVRLLTRDEFSVLSDARIALAKSRENDSAWMESNKAPYGWANFSEVAGGECIMWECPWYHDPQNPEDAIARENALAQPEKRWYLSKFYWKDWSDKRPPLCVLTPNGKEWVVDAVSSNGDGWQVSFMGDWREGKIICTPSIQVPGYHGFLGSNGARPGFFTDAI